MGVMVAPTTGRSRTAQPQVDLKAPKPTTKPPKSRLQRLFVVLTVASIVVPVTTIAVLAAAVLYLPVPTKFPPLRPGIDSQITRVFDKTGSEVAVLHRFDTTIPVSASDIPEHLKQAVVAVEDRRFYEHRGIDTNGVLRALWKDVDETEYVQGASTITQQYVRMAYVGQQKTLQRKLREAMLARRLDRQLPKEEILYRYLSRIYLGGGAYGVGAAAESYFRKSVRDLTLSEAALLAGLIPAPTRLEPRSNPVGAEAQRQLVLRKMVEQRRITPAQLAEELPKRVVLAGTAVEGEPVTVVHPPPRYENRFPYFADYVERYLVARFGADRVYGGGLRVETSLDPELQAKAEDSVSTALRGTDPPLDMALVSVEPSTGLVRALVGGRDFASSQVNLALGNCTPSAVARATDPGHPLCVAGGGGGRQPGSAFKPFTLAKALESGMSPQHMYNGPRVYTYPNCNGEGCTVHNVESGRSGRMNLEQATAFSVNTVFAQLIQDVGVKETAELAHRLGLTMIDPDGKQPSGEPYGPSLTLGAAEVSPLDMAAAYSVFPARGLLRPATPIVRVTDAGGRVLEDNSARQPARVLPEDVADNVTKVLQATITGGTGRRADIRRPGGTAGKTGTSEDYVDAWFVGFTPELSTSVWMGYTDSRRSLVGIKGLSRVYGGTIPAQAWHDFMVRALESVPPGQFAEPARVTPPPPPPVVTAPDRVIVYEPPGSYYSPYPPVTIPQFVVPSLPYYTPPADSMSPYGPFSPSFPEQPSFPFPSVSPP